MKEIIFQKVVWLNILTLLVNLGQYFLTNSLFPKWAVPITIAIGVIQIIINSINGVQQNKNIKNLKVKYLS
jgi:hypothetical protein